MKIFIGADHNGFELKAKLTEYLKAQGHEVADKGNEVHNPADDFPLYSANVAQAVLANAGSMGVLICGSGQGVCMAANRYKGIRASLIWNEAVGRAARKDSDSNVLCLSSDDLSDFDKAKNLVDTWLATPFDGADRFQRRIKQLDELA